MLVLTRVVGRSIIISYKNKNKLEKVTIALLNIGSTTAKIGIDAPKRIPVYRREIYKKALKNHKLSTA